MSTVTSASTAAYSAAAYAAAGSETTNTTTASQTAVASASRATTASTSSRTSSVSESSAAVYVRKMQEYTQKNASFSSGFKTILTNLKTAVKSFRGEDIVQKDDLDDEEGNISDMLSKASDFVDAYNKTIDFLKKKRGLSQQEVNQVLKDFKMTKNMSKQLAEVGISVNTMGKMTIDEDVMRDSLTNNESRYREVLHSGKQSLSARTYTKVLNYLDNVSNIIAKPHLSIEA